MIDSEDATVAGSKPAISGWAYSIAADPAGKFVLVGGEGGQLKRIKLAF